MCATGEWRPFWTGELAVGGYVQVLGLGSMFGVGGSGAGVVVSSGGDDVVDGALLGIVCWWMDGVWLGGGGLGLWVVCWRCWVRHSFTAQSTTLHPTLRSDHSAQPSSRPIKNRGRRTQDQDK